MLCKNFDDRTDRLVSRWTKDEQWDKRDQNPGEENGEFPGETDECGTNRAGHPTCKATHQTMIVPTVAKLSQGQNSAGEKTDQSSQAD